MTKKYKSGLILGRFMPLHRGHMTLMNSAANCCDNLKISVCSTPEDEIPGYLRYEWVKSYCKNNISFQGDCVIGFDKIDDNLIELKNNDAESLEKWRNIIKEKYQDIDVIYSSTKYGFELAEKLNIKHEFIGRERENYFLSSEKIRNNPYDNWKYIFAGARPYFMHRIYFLNPEPIDISKVLSEKFETNFVPDYKDLFFGKKEWNTELMDFFEIVIKQREIENNLAQRTQSQILFCDTDIIALKALCKLLYPYMSYTLNDFFDYHIKKQLENKCHFFVTYPADNDNIDNYNTIVKELEFYNIKYSVLNGSDEEKISVVEEFINLNNYNIKPEEEL